MSRTRTGLGIVLLSTLFSCGGTPPAPAPVPAPPPVDAGPPVSTLPPDGPVPVARTGDLPPVETTLPALHVTKRFVHGDTETLLVPLESAADARDVTSPTTVVHLNDRTPSFAFVSTAASGDPSLWIRRPLTEKGKALDGTIAVAASTYPVRAGKRLAFHVDADRASGATDAALEATWTTAAAEFFESRTPFGDDFSAFAADRLRRMAGKAQKAKRTNGQMHDGARPSNELDEDLDVMSGGLALRSALALEESPSGLGAGKGNVTPSSVHAFAMPAHPWSTMRQASPSAPPKPEPLAALVPAEFYYVRANDTPTLEKALDQLDTWGTAAMHLGGTADDFQLAASYQTQLGLVRGHESKLVGGAAIGQIAIVGSDVYLSEGTDVSILFEVKAPPLFDAALAEALTRQAQGRGVMKETMRTHDDVSITVSTTDDGAIHRERADLGDGHVVLSNSPAALDRILDTAKGGHAKLASEPDFAYVRARDAATPDEVFAFVGDRFLTTLVSPRTRILEARRRIASAELTLPAYSALLYGWLEGRSPKTTNEIVQAGLLDKNALTHSRALGGGAITFQPESAPSSKWGRPGTMVPLIDLPTPATYTKSEAESYEQFAGFYRTMWSEYVDPAAVRLDFANGKMSIDVRELPIPTLSEYRDLGRLAGDTRVAVPSGGDGARFTIAIGRDSELRRDASSFLGNFSETKDDLLGWLGDSITVGVLDRSVVASSVRELTSLPEPPPDSDAAAPANDVDPDFAAVGALPIYACIDVKNPVTAGLLLAIGKKQIERELSDAVHWEDGGKEGSASITRIRVDAHADMPAFSIVYAFEGGSLDVALDDAVLRTVIRARKAGDRAIASHSTDTGAQHVLEIASEPHDGLWTALAWLSASSLERSASLGARFEAEAYFRGIPEHAKDPELLWSIAQLYAGSQPRSPDDAQYHWSDEGVVDPAHGTFAHLRWPALPVAGSPMAKVLASIARLRTELAFDDESAGNLGSRANAGSPPTANAPLRSLHARATFVLR